MTETVSVPVIAAVVAGVVTVIGALVTGIVTIISAYKIAKIEGHVNSEKTASEGRQLLLTNQIEMQKKQLEHYERTAQLLAQAAAISQRSSRATDMPVTSGPIPVEVVNQPLQTTSAPSEP